MAQNDFVIADQTASAALSDINSAFQALASCSSGSTEPSVKYANQLWYDTTTHILKVRNEANSAWISVLYVHQADGAVHILDNTYISDTSGNHVGLLGDQATSEWTTGTGTTESLVSPAKLKAAIDANAPTIPDPVGFLQSASSTTVFNSTVAGATYTVTEAGYYIVSYGNISVNRNLAYMLIGSNMSIGYANQFGGFSGGYGYSSLVFAPVGTIFTAGGGSYAGGSISKMNNDL